MARSSQRTKSPFRCVFKIPTRGKLDWAPASHPLHNRLNSDRFGLGLPFAKAYLKDKPEVSVGLIPMAWGGASIDKFMKGSETYRETLEKARHAIGKRNPQGRGCGIKGNLTR